MALPNQVQSIGGGNSIADGIYTLSPTNDVNGYPYYNPPSGSCLLRWSGTAFPSTGADYQTWVFDSVDTASTGPLGANVIYYGGSTSSTIGPAGTYTGGGVAGPTVTNYIPPATPTITAFGLTINGTPANSIQGH